MKNLIALFITFLCAISLYAQETPYPRILDQNVEVHEIVTTQDENDEMINVAQLIVYPNPFDQTTTISTTEAGTIEIVTMKGNLMKEFDVDATSKLIDVHDLEEGFYLVKLRTKTSVYTVRVLKID